VKNTGEIFEKGLWFSIFTNKIQRIGKMVGILGLSGLIIIFTCITIINNLLYVQIAPNMALVIIGICISSLFIITPAIWFDIHMLKTRSRDLT
jgi:hypothetical protein